MKAEIICIGDELLIGQTVNTNAAWLGEKLNASGIRVHRCTAIADDASEIKLSLDEACSRSQIVLLTGGLGPTKDDITKKTLCEYFNTTLLMHDETRERIITFFSERGLPILPVNIEQALLPESCTVIPNYRGTAAGMWFSHNDCVIVSMPGVPYEMHEMMETTVLKRLESHFSRPVIVHRTVLTTGVGESFLAEKIKDWELSLSSDSIKLAYLPSPGMVKLRMSIYGGGNESDLLNRISEKEKELHEIIGEHIYGYDKDTLASVVGQLLRKTSQSLSLAESCTGGYLSHLVTSVAGSSDYYRGGAIAYSDPLKSSVLRVDVSLIETNGAVSQEVVLAMAEGARVHFASDYAVATTGYAGPTGGNDKIPTGAIWIAVSGPHRTISVYLTLGKRRSFNIEMFSNAALNLLRKEILSQSD